MRLFWFAVLLVTVTTLHAEEKPSPEQQRHQEAVEEIKRQGGTYYEVFRGWKGNPSHADLREWKGSNYAQLSDLKKLEMVWLPTNITDEMLEELDLPELQFIRFTGGPISDQGFSDFISRHPKLIRVTLVSMSNVTDEGLSSLGHLKHLKGIEFLQIPVTDEGFKKFPTDLQFVNIRQGKLTAACLAHAAQMKDIEFLYLHDIPKLKIGEVAELFKLPKLQLLEIRNNEGFILNLLNETKTPDAP